MPSFNNLNNLLKHLQQNVIPDIMNNEVYETVVETESDMVMYHVYDKYVPYLYQRRGLDGGLADPNNHIATFSYRNNTVEMFVQNVTRGKWDDNYIAGVVEYGHDNGHGSYDFPYNRSNTEDKFLNPRPFTYETIQELKRTLKHVESFRRGLNRHGIRTYK